MVVRENCGEPHDTDLWKIGVEKIVAEVDLLPSGVVMRNLLIIAGLFTSLAIAACRTSAVNAPLAQRQFPAVTEAPSMPIGVGWQLGDNLLVQSKSWSLAIHALQLEAEDTILFVSLSGLALDELTSQYTVSMIDNAGKEYKLRDAIPLTSRDQLQVGALVLLPPTPEADELNLVIKQGDTPPLQMQIAKGTGPQEWRQRSGAVTLLFRKGYLDQSNYRISYNGASVTGDLTADSLSGKGMTTDELLHNRATAAAKSTSQPGATPEIAPPRQFALALAGGEAIAHEMSWRVQDMAKNQVYYVYVIVTEGGNIKGTIVE